MRSCEFGMTSRNIVAFKDGMGETEIFKFPLMTFGTSLSLLIFKSVTLPFDKATAKITAHDKS